MSTQIERKRVDWLDLNGTRVLFMDFAGASVAESLTSIRDFLEVMQRQAPQSVLLLSDVTDAAYDASISRQWKEARLRYDDVIRASAIYGLKGLVGVAVRGFIDARRLLGLSAANGPRIFSSAAEAREWLVKQ
jgi:hypothetical protein